MTNTTLGQEGLGQQPWWVVEWMELINSYRYKKRLERAWIYAREGNVLSIRFEGRRVQARVQGTEPEPYKLKLWLDVLNDEDWDFVLEALLQKARWTCQLLAGVMPDDIERAFAASGKRLFPFKLQEVRSCQWAVGKRRPVCAVPLGPQPQPTAQGAGRTAQTAAARAKESGEAPAALSPTLAPPPDPGLVELQRALDPDLVVITPAMEGSTGLDEAGELALNPFPRGQPTLPRSAQAARNHGGTNGDDGSHGRWR